MQIKHYGPPKDYPKHKLVLAENYILPYIQIATGQFCIQKRIAEMWKMECSGYFATMIIAEKVTKTEKQKLEQSKIQDH